MNRESEGSAVVSDISRKTSEMWGTANCQALRSSRKTSRTSEQAKQFIPNPTKASQAGPAIMSKGL